MPSFNAKIAVETIVEDEVEFEVFCGTCGAGLCSESTGGNTHGRNQPFVQVNACETCIQSACDELRADLENQLQEAQDRVQELEEETADQAHQIATFEETTPQ